MKKLFIIITCVLLQFESIQIEANNYIWLHGLNDKVTCWQLYDQTFTPGISSRKPYSCNQTVENISNQVWRELESSKNTNMILIGHSLGGIVAREIEYDYRSTGKVKGIITIGTPHHGAQIENETASGALKSMASKIVNMFMTAINASIDAFGRESSIMSGAVKATKDLKQEVLVDAVLSNFADGTLPCEKQIQVGSSYMKTINDTRKVDVPILCFAAEEDRWSLARMGYCGTYKDDLQTKSNLNTDGKFDQSGYNIMSAGSLSAGLISVSHSMIYPTLFIFGIYSPKIWHSAERHYAAAAYWSGVSNYLNNGIDFDHSKLIGATRVDAIPEQHKFLWKKWTTYTYVTVPEPHDGLVPVKSQQLDKSKGTNVIWANSTIKGVNHMEEFNHPNTRAEFNKAIVLGAYKPETFQK